MAVQILMNYKRIIFRNKSFFFFSLVLPVTFYLLFTKVLSVGVPENFVKTWQLNYLVSMAVYSSLISSVITVANTLLEDREKNFSLFVKLTGTSLVQYYGTMMAVFVPLNILATTVLGLVGRQINQVSISPQLWISFLIMLPILSFPMILIGLLISLVGQAALVNILSQITMFFMAIVGGLWWPIEMLPKWLEIVGKCLPTYQITLLIQEILHKSNPSMSALVGLGIWLVALILVLVLVTQFIRIRELQVI